MLSWSPVRVSVEAVAPSLPPGPFFVGVFLVGVSARGVPAFGVAVRDKVAIFSCFSLSLAAVEMGVKRHEKE